ncbi:hypothetical protein IV38_GL001487 [Lactobacillus selangorensis]|uniref:Uncharacterized protein n=1 Tax=Lactobacillus selangorensis TaxID=81857 RepID=A0A0R2FQ60_9LACO|nr:daptomycin-sensing surface protein LiaX [Lactobacillus selangorensis]KRN28485.1 hypothetical protein IV38_GL001487 [Lactobacillus selangorensis]KRN31985.1 hypothetical protein IV40_GL001273 [Lactobacillus selangorensis]
MNERERILDLVKKGVLSSEEALVLLENMANDRSNAEQQNHQQTQQAATSAPEDDTESESDDTDDEQSTADVLEEQRQTLAVKLDSIHEKMQNLQREKKGVDEQLTVYDTMEDLDTLTDEKAKLRVEARKESARLENELDELADEEAKFEEDLATVNSQKRHERRQQVKDKIPDDWKTGANDAVTNVSEHLGQFGQFVQNTVQSVMDNVDWKDVTVHVPGIATEKFDHEFVYEDAQATIIDVKVANGDLTFKTWDQPNIKVAARIKLFGKMPEATPLEAFEARSRIEVTGDQFLFHVPNKRVQADLTIYLPERSYDHTNVQLLNGNISFAGFTGKDLYVKNTNGVLSFDDLNATMLETEGVNGDVKVVGGSLLDALLTTVNGSVILRSNVQNAELSTVNGDVKTTLTENTLDQLKASSVNGNVKVAVPDDTALKGDATTRWGSIKDRMTKIKVLNERHSTGRQEYQFEREITNQKPAKLTLATTSGNIQLKDHQTTD